MIKNTAFFTLVLGILSMGVALAAAPGGGGPMPATSVEAARVSSGPLERSIEAVGNLISNESVVLSPEIPGRVTQILFEEGEDVAIDSPLIRMDDSIYQAELAQAQASLVLSQENYNRAQELLKAQIGTARSRDESLSKLNIDRATVELAKAQANKMLITAPFEGIVGLRHVSVGNYVTPGQALVNFESIDPLKVDFRIAEVFLSSLKTGQKIEVSVDAYPDRVFEGEVYAIDPRVDSAGRAIILRAKLPNPELILRPGLFARVKLVLEQKENAIMIDEQALIPQGNEQFVYRVIDGKAVMTKVNTGMRRAGKVEITSGLTTSDTIITAGQMKLRPNAAVTVLPPVVEPSAGEGMQQ